MNRHQIFKFDLCRLGPHKTVAQIATTMPELLEVLEAARSLEQQLFHVLVRFCFKRQPSPSPDRLTVRRNIWKHRFYADMRQIPFR
jgi:hypothetical protein